MFIRWSTLATAALMPILKTRMWPWKQVLKLVLVWILVRIQMVISTWSSL
jgi:hypothetical protein